MSDETEKEIDTANNDEDTKAQQNANVDAANGDQSTTKEPKKFSVNRVKFDPELTDPPEKNAAGSDEPSTTETPGNFVPKSPTSPEQFTFGYATNEAIPMTIFYRSQHSQGHGGKQRPTLQELRKRVENDKVREYLLSYLSISS